MRVVLWGTYDTGKPRVRLLREGMRRAGIDVLECPARVFEGVEDKSQVHGWRKLGLLLRWLAAYPALIVRYLAMPVHDLVLVSYPGLLDVLVIRVFAWLRRTPIAWDVFISAYDTVVDDRKLVSPRHPLARVLWCVEWLAARACNLVFLDTQAHARRFESLYGLPPQTCGAVWVGVETDAFAPVQGSRTAPATDDGPRALRVLFYGQFIPLHGIATIVEAARLTADHAIDWTLVGHGQESAKIDAMLAERPLARVRRIDWVPYDDLRRHLAEADVCLGIFGTSAKAASVIPNKVFQILAAQRPLVTRDSPAIRELVQHAPPCVTLVPAGDARALADAVLGYAQSAHETPQRCHEALLPSIDATAVGRQFAELAARVVRHGH